MLACLVVAGAGTGDLAHALDHEHIDEVLVTATRRAVSSDDIAAAVSLVSQDRIREKQLLTDALDGQAGVFLQQTTPGQGAAIIRGQRGSAVLHLVDGMRLNNAIFRSAPTQYLALVPTTAVERIEILRGTQASLYGSDAVGGAINVVTRVPKLEQQNREIQGDVMLGFNTAEKLRVLRANVDIGNRYVASSLSGELLETSNRHIGGGAEVPYSGYESKSLRMLMSLTPDERQSWLFDVQYLEQPMTPRTDELVPGFGQSEPSSSEFFFAPNRRLFVHARYAVLGGPLQMDWQADVAWQRIDDDRRTRDFQSPRRLLETNRSDLSGVTLSASRVNALGSFVVGAEIYHDRVSSQRREQDIVSGQVQDVAARFPDGSSVDQFAVFANVDRSFAARQHIGGGIRISTVKIDIASGSVTQAAEISTTDGSGDIGWRFEVSPQWQIVANMGLGFRAPNVFDLGSLGNRPGNRFNIPNIALESERVLQGDLGVRYRAAGGGVELMVYELRYDDKITSVLTGDVTAEGRDVVQSINAADATARGAELAVNRYLGESIELSAALNYTWGEQTVGVVSEAGDRIPPLSGRANLQWHFSEALRLFGALDFAGEQTRLSARDSRDVRIDPDGTRGWGTLGLGAEWSGAEWLLTLRVDNILDKGYRRHGSGIDSPGRNLAISVRRVW